MAPGGNTDFGSSAAVDRSVLPRVVCVDLDGSLVATDTLWESLLGICLRRPLALIPVLLSIFRGKARFKSTVARYFAPDVDRLPYRPDLLRYLREQKSAGRTVILATSAHESIANAVAAHLTGLFDGVLATTDAKNLRGRAKGEALAEKFGGAGFTYVGNGAEDLSVWRYASAAIPVGARPGVRARIPVRIEAEFCAPRSRWRALANAVRLHQWVKNLLVFVPLLTSRDVLNLAAAGKLLLVAVALSLVASGQYLLNDLIDLDSDRQHASKRRRALASGELSIAEALLLAAALLAAGGGLGFVAGSRQVVILLGVYFAASVLYSTFLKSKPLVDVFALAGLYVFRIVIGGFVSDHHATVWLINFSFLCFLSLGFLKRCIEVARLAQTAKEQVGGRGYGAGDTLILTTMGVASSFASIVVLALYVYSEAANKLYARPSALWGFVPICLLVQCRLWLSGSRGDIEEDPVRHAISDRVVWASVALSAAVYWLATRGTY